MTFHLDAAGRRVARQARRAARERSCPPGRRTRTSGTKPLPGTGAVHVHEVRPEPPARSLVRNPHFKEWSADAQPDGYPDKITYAFGLTGRGADHADRERPGRLDARPAARPTASTSSAPSTRSRCTSTAADGELVRADERQHSRRSTTSSRARPSTTRSTATPPCASSAARSWRPRAARSCPPASRARVDYCPYTKNPGAKWSAPDLAKAKPLVKQSGTAGAEGRDRSSQDDDGQQGDRRVPAERAQLIGYKASVKAISGNIQFTYIQNTNNKVQISGHAVVPGLPGGVGLPERAARLRVVPPRQRHAASTSPASATRRSTDDMKKALALGITDPEARTQALGQDRQAMHGPGAARRPVQPASRSTSSRSGSATSCSLAVLLMFSTRPGSSSARARGDSEWLTVVAAAGDVGTARVVGRSPWALAGRRLLRNRAAMAALVGVLRDRRRLPAPPVYARHVAHTDPFQLQPRRHDDHRRQGRAGDAAESTGGLGLGVTPIGPTWDLHHYFLGADDQGRDVAARLLYGGRNSLLIGIVGGADLLLLRDDHRARRPASSAASSTAPVAHCSTSSGRSRCTCWRSRSRSCCSRSGLSLGPVTLGASSLWLPILIIASIYVPYVARPIRGQVLSLREKEFVEAAIGLGAPQLAPDLLARCCRTWSRR